MGGTDGNTQFIVSVAVTEINSKDIDFIGMFKNGILKSKNNH